MMRLPSYAMPTPAPLGRQAVAAGIGPIAIRALRPGARGSVRAVFERCFYVELESGWACIGPEDLGAGPLNLVCARWPAGPLRAHVCCGDVAEIDAGMLLAGHLAIALGEAAPWLPERVGHWDKASLSRGLAATDEALRALAPRDGLALLSGEDGSFRPALLSSREDPLAHLEQLLAEQRAVEPPPIDVARIAPLLGLGPGLTPSGDDYLGGLLVALSLVGRSAVRDHLWQALHPLTIGRTTAISRAHLAAAAEGLGSAALHHALGAILSGATEKIAAACAGLAKVGHTSGWDALAGALSVLRAHTCGHLELALLSRDWG
jgi:Protein of unknown function (DUF2877)